MTCRECGKKVHLKKYFRSKGNGSGGGLPKKSPNKLPEWVTKNRVVSDTTYIETATMTRIKKKYKWCTSWNNGQGIWGFHCTDIHEECKDKQGKKSSLHFSNPATNHIMCCSYLMTTNED